MTNSVRGQPAASTVTGEEVVVFSLVDVPRLE